MLSVEILADSVGSWDCTRLTTFRIRVGSMIWQELLTHRAFSRNAASKRAIPYKKMRDSVLADPYIPTFQSSKAGMSGGALDPEEVDEAEAAWRTALNDAINHADALYLKGTHKAASNLLLWPFMYVDGVITSSYEGLENFFRLRRHSAAHPDMIELANLMHREYSVSTPRQMRPYDIHLPFKPPLGLSIQDQLYFCCGAAARVSYADISTSSSSECSEYLIDLGRRLILSDPPHSSVAEHIAIWSDDPEYYNLSGNLSHGWIQYRKVIETDFDLTLLPCLNSSETVS